MAKLKKRSSLGRGLSSLLSDSDLNKKEENNEVSAGGIFMISPQDIVTNPYQPRTDFDQEALEELAESIKIQGIIQPITVRQLEKGKYQLISGERRLQAAKLILLDEIPAYVRTANDQQMLEMALIENIQRQDLNAVEVALSYQRLIAECKLKQEELGSRVGKKRTTVNNYLRLLKLPPEIQAGLRDKKIAMGHARALVNVDQIDVQVALYQRVVEEGLSVRAIEQLVRDFVAGKPKEKEIKAKKYSEQFAEEVNNLQGTLCHHFGTKVKVKPSAENKGEIAIPFTSLDELNRILEMMDVRVD